MIMVLAEGTVEAQGTLGALLHTSAELQRLWAGDLGSAGPAEGGG
jgi:hypothetical protein